MKQLMQSLIIAFSMYSKIPMPAVDWKKENMRYAICLFPLVGLAIGGAVWGWLWVCLRLEIGRLLTAAGAAAIPLLVTGGIHMDGFCDTVDALASHAPMPRKLEILKDPHTGAFALIGCVVYLLLITGMWGEFSFSSRAAGVAACGFVFSRALSGLSVVVLRKAKPDGLVSTLSDAASRRATTVLTVFAVLSAAGMLTLSLVSGGLCLAGAGLCFLSYRRMAYRQFGGITGDLAGYFLQQCELLMLAAIILVQILEKAF